MIWCLVFLSSCRCKWQKAEQDESRWVMRLFFLFFLSCFLLSIFHSFMQDIAGESFFIFVPLHLKKISGLNMTEIFLPCVTLVYVIIRIISRINVVCETGRYFHQQPLFPSCKNRELKGQMKFDLLSLDDVN